ncbi:alkaline phosphatase [Wenzhouxiangella sp. XN24]|uniref:alkaline phosphatase n=1 Tax=Wenzhouxiangella sp. XN24 TaxID=2713569 RepID=UPI0013EB1E56|nr:alkaline phosphatase [Wenzhouxiangella sp. XN24]NGX16494.1 alkaline phosphatase [Wenzhouxiangella sp. XN24]
MTPARPIINNLGGAMKRLSGIARGFILCLAAGPSYAEVSATPQAPLPRNVILIVGDGLGFSHLLAGRYHRGDLRVPLVMEQLPSSGTLETLSLGEEWITDSAASASAMSTGSKTTNGRIATTPAGESLETLFEALRARGYAVGVATTGDLNGATAAAFITSAPSRRDKEAISRGIVRFAPDVMVGNSVEFFHPEGPAPLRAETLQAAGWGVHVDVPFDDIPAGESPVLIGYSEYIDEAQSLQAERNVLQAGAPHLAEAMRFAIQQLSRVSEKGFFLLVEEDWIDSWGHDNNFSLLAEMVVHLDDTVAAAREYAEKDQRTLLVVTSDHECCGLTITAAGAGKVTAEFASEDHTAQPVPLFAYGPGAGLFGERLDNTDIRERVLRLLQ